MCVVFIFIIGLCPTANKKKELTTYTYILALGDQQTDTISCKQVPHVCHTQKIILKVY